MRVDSPDNSGAFSELVFTDDYLASKAQNFGFLFILVHAPLNVNRISQHSFKLTKLCLVNSCDALQQKAKGTLSPIPLVCGLHTSEAN